MSDNATAPHSGLFHREGRTEAPVPLAGVTVEAELHGFHARVIVSHRFINREAQPIEATYVFPLDEGAAVCGFEAVIDGTLVIGEVLEREQAFERYDDAIGDGHGAFLLDEERPDVFQASIGNLLPGREALVRLTYVAELTVDDGRLRFVVPTTVSPRYAPDADRKGVGRTDAEALNPPVAWTVPYGLNLSVRAVMPGAISVVESPSHPISLRINGGDATITLAQDDVALDRDFVLSIEAAGLDAPHAIVERHDDQGEAIGVAFAPRFENSTTPGEVIFVVDRSGSMDGDSIGEVRNALQLCLRSLTPGCRFNIVGFGSSYETLFPESRAYDQSALEIASAHVARLGADLGGTEILAPLTAILEKAGISELPRQLVVLTDGEVTNTDAVIELASLHAARARIFTFGIGAGASHHLVRGLARAGGGSAEFIYPGERIEPKVLRQFKRLLSPALTDVRIEWIGGRVTQSPAVVPPIFHGGRLLVYGFVDGERPRTVRLSANSPSGQISFDVAVPANVAAPASSRGIVSTLAARARIRELEEGVRETSAGSRQLGRKDRRVRNEIVALSVRYGLLSRETSFVAVERREAPVIGDVQLRKVPIALTTGWGGGKAQRPAPTSLPPPRLTRMRVALSAPPPVAARGFGPLAMGGEGDNDLAFCLAEPLPHRARTRDVKRSRMQELVVLQQADGTWPLTEELARAIGRDLDELRDASGAARKDPDAQRAWATALALAWLELHAGDLRDEWEMLADKGRRWLMTVAPPSSGEGYWIDLALAVVRQVEAPR